MFGLLKPDKILPQLCAGVTLLRVTSEFYAQNPWAYTTQMLKDHAEHLWTTRVGLLEMRNSLMEFDERRKICFETYWYFAYLLMPLVMAAPVAKWKAMLGIALKDMDIAQACTRRMMAPTARVA